MQIILNGNIHPIDERITLHDLISSLDYNVSNFAVAVNFAVVPKSRYNEFWLHENDKVEIVSAFQGG